MHLKPFAHNSAGGDTHSHIHQLITRSRSKPHTRGPWSPWSPCRRKEEEFVFKCTEHTRMHRHKYGANNKLRLAPKSLRHNSEHIDKGKKITGTLNYSLRLRVKSLMITWTDMNWVWEKEKEREQWCEVWWVWWGRGGECGWTPLPGQIVYPRDLWLSASIGEGGGWSLRMEHSWRRKRLGSDQPVCRGLWVYRIKVKRTTSRLLLETTKRTTECWTQNYNLNLSRITWLNTVKPSHLMRPTLLLEELQFSHSRKMNQTTERTWTGILLKQTSMYYLSNFK